MGKREKIIKEDIKDHITWRLIMALMTVLLLFLFSCAPIEWQSPGNPETDQAMPQNAQIPSGQEDTSPTEPPEGQAAQQPPIQEQESHQQERSDFSPLFTPMQGCEEKERLTFTSLPLDITAIIVVEPQGELTGYVSGHITPGDHVGFQYDKEAPATNVYALADGYLVRVERNPGYFGIGTKNYHLYIEYSCTMFGSYVHVTDIAPELLQADRTLRELNTLTNVPDDKRNILVRIPIKAGQIIGQTEKWGLLGMLTVDTTTTLVGFENPQLYAGEPWKIHAVPAFGYFAQPLQTQLMQKNPRTKEPRGGKIDFDQPAKLVGNWFVQGTDYAGDKSQPFCGDYICPYWSGHLAFVYDFVDPAQIRVSIGYDTGLQDQGPYGVKSNTPDPAAIRPAHGIVKYELVGLNDVSAARGFPSQGKALITENKNEIIGTLLVQMLEPRKIKMEVFPGKSAAKISGFTDKAKIYYR